MMKAEFMTLWDGLTTSNDIRILVLGATNRPNDIDQAILRRMPKRFAIKLPNADQRRKILELMLRDIPLEPSFDVSSLVRRTDGLSGSDLKEACRNAAMVPVREYMRLKESKTGPVGRRVVGGGIDDTELSLLEEEAEVDKVPVLRPLRLSDFLSSSEMEHYHERHDHDPSSSTGLLQEEAVD